jgi:acetylornithine/succinyldiaminopimelate/putrescine aminotransferase
MAFDISQILAAQSGRNYELQAEHINPRWAKALGIIGFDKCYERAEGAYLWDREGTKYLDTLAGYSVFNIGRNHPVVRQALTDFMAADYPSLVQIEAPLLSGVLAQELKRRVGYGLERVYFTSTGAEGVETAIKFARKATGRPKILFASNAFHGLTNGALALNGADVFRENFGPLLPHCSQVPFNDAGALEEALSTRDVAAFIVEPVQGKGAALVADGYLREATRLCREAGTLLVADEIQSGMGRTGRFLAIQHDDGAEPDMVIISKSLSGGYVPVGAVLLRDQTYNKVFNSLDRAVVHSSTFGQGSLAMVAGLATLSVIDDDKLMQNALAQGDALGQALRAMKDEFEFIRDVRWRGLMIGIEFAKPKSLKLKTAWATANKLNKDLFCQAITIPMLSDHKVLTQVAGNNMTTIKLTPPLTMTPADVAWFLDGFRDVMTRLHKFPGPAWEAIYRIARNAVQSGSTSQPAAE